MARPALNGGLASSAGVSGMRSAGAASLPSLPGMGLPDALPQGVGLGLLVAMAVLAYWYRRVL
jgi:hypothetical protein